MFEARRFWIFTWYKDRPEGGMGDFWGASDSKEDAVAWASGQLDVTDDFSHDVAEVWDMHLNVSVWKKSIANEANPNDRVE